jgi:hypothetical protein
LKTVIFGDSVGLIGNEAFYNCINLDTIICKPYNVPIIYPNTFYNVRKNAVVYVPCYRSGAYKNSQWKWGEAFNDFIEMCVGVVETHCNASLRVHPNPTTGQLQITNYELRDNTVIELYDIYGKKLSHFTFHNSHQQIDISHLANGIYFITFHSEGQKITRKVVKY